MAKSEAAFRFILLASSEKGRVDILLSPTKTQLGSTIKGK